MSGSGNNSALHNDYFFFLLPKDAVDIYINQGDDKGDRKEKKLTLSSKSRDTGRAYSQTETYLDISSAYIVSFLSIHDAMLLHPIKTSYFIKY